jgi:hypothetical protein
MLVLQDIAAANPLVQEDPLVIDLVAEAIPQGVSEATTTTTVGDSVYDRTTGVTTWFDYHFSTSVSGEASVVLQNLDPEVATLTGDLLTRVTDGFCSVKATRGNAWQIRQVDCRETVGGTLDVLSSFTNNSVADHVTDEALAMFTDAGDGRYYSIKNHATATYTRNPACLAAGLNLSAIAVASNRIDPAFSTRSCGTAITARHVIGAGHTGWRIGTVADTQLRFATPDGVVHTRNLIGRSDFGDVVVATLDSALPAGITPIKICGDWIITTETEISPDYYRSTFAGAAIHLDQHGYVKWTLLGSASGYIYSGLRTATINGAVVSAYSSATCFSAGAVTGLDPTPAFAAGKLAHVQNGLPGDSGLPLMVLSGGELGILWTWLGQTVGPPVWDPGLLDAMIAAADADAGVSTGLTATYLADPTA